jgi:hypothetical protein
MAFLIYHDRTLLTYNNLFRAAAAASASIGGGGALQTRCTKEKPSKKKIKNKSSLFLHNFHILLYISVPA